MSTEALATWEVEKKEKVEKERVEKEKLEAKTALEKGNEEHHAQIAQDTMIRYHGSLRSKCRVELEDISCLLCISFTPKTTIPQHTNAIVAHLGATPKLADNPRFEGLYTNIKQSSSGAAEGHLPTSPAMTEGSQTASTSTTTLTPLALSSP